MYYVFVHVKNITKQEKLLLKFDSILAALGVCDQVILNSVLTLRRRLNRDINIPKFNFPTIQPFPNCHSVSVQASIDKIFRHLSQHSQLPLEEEGTPTAEAEKRWQKHSSLLVHDVAWLCIDCTE